MPDFYFTLDDDHQRLDWVTPGGGKPTLTEQQAMIVAVASIASALENVVLQLHSMTETLQEIADKRS